MNWFNTGAVIILGLLALNSTIIIRRAGAHPQAGRNALGIRRRRRTGLEVGLGVTAGLSWVIGLALPVVTPGNEAGQFMAHWWALPSLFAWSTLLVVVVLVVKAVATRLPASRNSI
jgi:hypothetical protein